MDGLSLSDLIHLPYTHTGTGERQATLTGLPF
jgi:hypothetical protein